MVKVCFLITDCGTSTQSPFSVVNASSTTYGAVGDVFCIPGYLVVGDTKVTCEANGSWSPSNASCVPTGIVTYFRKR